MAAVFEGRVHWLGFIERPIYRLLGTSPEQEQTWKRYAGAMIVFSFVSLLFTYVILRLQGSLPLNPQHLGAVGPALSFNTASHSDQHQLAELRRRDDDVVLLPDWRPHRSAVRLTGRGHRRRDRHGARVRSAQESDDR
jgi:hypothetical protein